MAAFLEETLRSIVASDYQPLEVIVVDDCSTDNMDCLKKYEGKIKLFSLKENKGSGYARNIILDNAEGEYIFGMDNDDYLYTDEFRKAMKELDGTDMVFINQRINNGFVFKLCEENKHDYCAFWTKFIKRDLIGNTRCIETYILDDYYFNEELMKKPHTEKYTDIVAYHYNYPREGSIIWKKDHNQL